MNNISAAAAETVSELPAEEQNSGKFITQANLLLILPNLWTTAQILTGFLLEMMP